MVKVVTDSTSDVPADLAADLSIGIVPAIVEIDGNSYLDGISLSRQQFYTNLNVYREIPKTAAPSPEQFTDLYRAAHAQGASEIISIHLNSGFSGLLKVAEVAARDASAEGVPVQVVDSQTVTMGLGWLAIIAARMADQGAQVNEIINRIEELRPHVRIYAVVDTLRYLRKSGRANALLAGIGDMLQIKVLLCVQNGIVTQIDRIRTRTRGLARLNEVAHSHKTVKHLSILYTSEGQERDLTTLRTALTDLVPIEQQFVRQVTPVIGAHVGPLAVGLAMIADV